MDHQFAITTNSKGIMSLTLAAAINRTNVGRIAERIVSNELEYRGFRVSDLNKEGTSANADLLAAKDGKATQVQVKGATYDGWWFGYGHCSDEIIHNHEQRFFNRSQGNFYRAEVVVLVCIKAPYDYQCLVLPVGIAEKAAQLNLDGYFRRPKRDGSPHKPGKMWVSLESGPKSDGRKVDWEKERDLLLPYKDDWSVVNGLTAASGLAGVGR